MATDDTAENSNTADYSATKAPENEPHVQSEPRAKDDTLIPGGRHGAKAAVGMSEMDRDEVPSGAVNPGQTDYGSPVLPAFGGLDRE
jgi:hypothetical protein